MAAERSGSPFCNPAASASARPTLRVQTCGSVDDGKSSLIGRLLCECGLVSDDQRAAPEPDSRELSASGSELSFRLLFDGLDAEREQGITVDGA